MTASVALLNARKTPSQARSTVTIEALHIAAIQVLTHEGLARCTTTRIAERAGVSVGSLYQYYPNRDALLHAVLKRHLDGVGGAVEAACAAMHGRPAAEMAAALVGTFLAAKLRDPAESKALYAVSEARDGAALVAAGRARMVAAVSTMLATAPDAHFDDLALVSAMALGAIVGPVRACLEDLTPPGFEAHLKTQLTIMIAAYLRAAAGAATGGSGME